MLQLPRRFQLHLLHENWVPIQFKCLKIISLSLFGEAKLLESVVSGFGNVRVQKLWQRDGWIDHMFMAHKTCVCIRRLKMSPFAVVAKWFAPSHFIRPSIAMKELIGSTLHLLWSFYSHTKCMVSFFAMDFSFISK
jgi:hypothetical protein